MIFLVISDISVRRKRSKSFRLGQSVHVEWLTWRQNLK